MVRAGRRYECVAEVGSLYFSKALGDVLVWDVHATEDRVEVYHCRTGDLGRVRLSAFNDGLTRGLIRRAARLSEIAACPSCNMTGRLMLVRRGAVRRLPFIVCGACTFTEAL
jgi:hypothetical protein